MDNLHKRSVSFASVVVDSLSNAKSDSSNKLAEAKRIGKSSSFRLDVDNSLSEGGLVLPLVSREEHCIVNDSADWKIRYGERVVNKEEDEEECHILQHASAYSPEAAPKRKREAMVTDSNKELQFEALRTVKRQKTTTSFIAPIEQAQNSLVCKVYLVDQRNPVNRWRRLVVPSSAYCQAVVDVVVDSFHIEHSPTFYAKRQFSDKYVFKGGLTKKHVKHAMLVPFSELNLEVGDGLNIFYGTTKLNFRVEYVRDSFSLKYNSERPETQVGEGAFSVNGVHIVGGNPADIINSCTLLLL